MILDRYIFRLWLGPFLGGLGMALAVLMLGRALRLLGQLSDRPQVWGMIAKLLTLSFPYFLVLTVPIAFFLSMQNSIATLQQNSEMDALRASGISYLRCFRILLITAVFLFVGLTYTSMLWLPQGQLEFNGLLLKIYTMKGGPSFAPQRFTNLLDNIAIYVAGEDNNHVYHGVILDDRRNSIPVIYTAKTARLESGGGETLILQMNNGMRMEGKGQHQRTLAFDSYKVNIPIPSGRFRQLHSSDHVTLMPPSLLWAKVQEGDVLASAEWSRRLLLPGTILVLCLFALPFSLSQKRSGKTGSLMLGVLLLVAVYNTLLFLHRQVSQGLFPTWSMWAGQMGMACLGAFLWLRAEQDRLPKLIIGTGEWFYLLHEKIMAGLAQRRGKQLDDN